VLFRGVKMFGNMMEVSLEHERNYQIDIYLLGDLAIKGDGEKKKWGQIRQLRSFL
jgi:hypothetical protein